MKLSGISLLRIANKTNGAESQYTLLDTDGSFSALLPLNPGKNTIEVYARAADGSEATRKLSFEFRKGAAPALPPRLAAQRERLTEQRLAGLREQSDAMESQIEEQLRSELQARIEEGRRKARERMREIRIEEERQQASGSGAAARSILGGP